MRRIPLLFGAVLLANGAWAQTQFGDVYGDGPSATLIGFVNVNFAAFEDMDEAASAKHGDGPPALDEGFTEARMALHLSARLSPQWSLFLEGELSVLDDDTRESVERAILKYSYSDALQISAGRYHTPIGWWNAGYHHGRWLQTTIKRPEHVEFGTTFLPVHYWGLMLEGRRDFESLALAYEAGIGAGRAESIINHHFAEPIDADTSYFVNLTIEPHAIDGWNLGTAYWTETLDIPGGQEIDEDIVNLTVHNTHEQPEVIAEYAWVRHDRVGGGGTVDSTGYYVQLAYRLDAMESRIKPYARIEDLDVDEQDLIYSELESLQRGLIGVRYDFNDNGAFKLELRRDNPDHGDSFNGVQAQFAFYF